MLTLMVYTARKAASIAGEKYIASLRSLCPLLNRYTCNLILVNMILLYFKKLLIHKELAMFRAFLKRTLGSGPK